MGLKAISFENHFQNNLPFYNYVYFTEREKFEEDESSVNGV